MKIFNGSLFLLFSLFALIALHREYVFSDVYRKKTAAPSRRATVLLLVFLASAAVFLRVWKFGSVPGGFNQDGAMAAVDGKALADYGTDRFGTRLPCHLTAWGFGQMSSLLSYLIAFFVRLFGLSPVTARLPQLLVSLAGAVFFWLFVQKAFGERAGLLAAMLVTVSPWQLLQSRWALDCNLLPHFFILSLYFLLLGLTEKKLFLYISMVFFALCMYCYGITIYTIPPMLLLLCLYLIRKKMLTVSDALLCAFIYLLISWPFILTMAVNAFGWETIELPFVTIQRFSSSVRSGDILLFSENFSAQLVSNLQSLFRVAVLQKKDLPWNDMAHFGTGYLFTLPLAVAGAVKLIRSKGVGKVLAVSGLFAAIWAGVLTNNVNVNRINLIFYFILLLDALGLELIFSNLKRSRLPVLLAFAAAAVLMVNSYFGSYAESIGHSFYLGFGDALLAAEDTGAEKIYITADTQYEGSRNVSEILTLFYEETDAEYFQGRKNTEHGTELLPYTERFIYVSMNEEIADKAKGENAALVIRLSDAEYFSSGYTLEAYGDYCMAKPK